MEEALQTQAMLAAVTGTDPLVYVLGVVGVMVGLFALYVGVSNRNDASVDKKIAEANEKIVYREAQSEKWQENKLDHAQLSRSVGARSGG